MGAQPQPQRPRPLIDKVVDAVSEQTVTAPGAEAVEIVIPRVAAQIRELKQQRDIVAGEVGMGLVQHMLDREYVLPKALDIASKIAANSPASIQNIREQVRMDFNRAGRSRLKTALVGR